MIYLDTSVLIAAHTSEPESARTINWMAAQKSPFMVSLWTITEFASALSRQVRSRRLTLDERARAAGEFQIFLKGVTIVAPEPEAFRLAARMMENPETGLRAADALHLAVASQTGAELATFDRTMADAARSFGISLATI